MEQLFTMYPNYFADQFRKSSKPENSIIDKYLESRMKVLSDTKANANSLSVLKSEKDNNNLKQGSLGNSGANLKSAPAKYANSKASDILQSINKNGPNLQDLTNSHFDRASNDFYDFQTQNSSEVSRQEPDDEESDFGVNFQDNRQQDNDLLGKEVFLGEHRYEYGKELEKSDEKESASMKDSEDRTSWDLNDKVARILKLVQSEDTGNEGGEQKFAKYGKAKLESNANLEIWTAQENRYSFYIFLVMVATIALGTFMRSANRVLEKVKIFFDVIFVTCWKWMKSIVSPSNNSEGNLFLFMLCTPIFIFLLVIYAGFSIVYYSNKALLARVPNKIAKQVNLRKIKEFSS